MNLVNKDKQTWDYFKNYKKKKRLRVLLRRLLIKKINAINNFKLI